MSASPHLPTRFSINYGGFFGGYVRISLEGGGLRVARDRGKPTNEGVTVAPSAEAWRRFWAAQRHTDLWHWPQTCQGGEDVLDGIQWSVHITYRERTVRSKGSNSYPFADGPEPSEQFNRFLESVEALIGGPLMP